MVKSQTFLYQLESFIIYLSSERRYSDHTVLAYQKDLQQFNSFLTEVLENSLLYDVNYNHVRGWVVDLSSNKIANRSINRKITSLRTYFRFLRKSDASIKNPCDRILALKIPKRLPSIVKEKELLNLFDLVFENGESYFQWRDFMVIELLYNTGMRKSELIGLQRDDIDIAGRTIKVMGKGKKERIIPFGSDLAENLLKYSIWRNGLNDVEGKIFFLSDSLKQLYPKAVYNIVKKYLSLLTTIEKKSPHTLRHSFATHLMNGGAELNAVKKLLGHSSLAATQVYTHNSIEELKNIYKRSHPKGA